MGYRKTKETVEAARNWSKFVARNKRFIEAAGLPQVVTESISTWDDFLMHGYLDHHDEPSRFTVDQLSDAQYAALVQAVDSYFVNGYEYFTPKALREEDQQVFEMRFRTS